MLGIRSIQKLSLLDLSILFLDELGGGILQPPNKNDNDKLNKIKKMYEDSSNKIE